VVNGPPSAKFDPPWLKPLVTPLGIAKFCCDKKFCFEHITKKTTNLDPKNVFFPPKPENLATGLIECVYSIAPERIVLGVISGRHWHWLPNRTVYAPIAEDCICQKPQISSQPSYLNLWTIVHNFLEQAVTTLMYHCKYINKIVLFQQKFAVGS